MTAELQAPSVGADAYVRFDQTVPAAVWTITHSLAKRPSVSVTDSANEVVEAEVDYIDDSTITITFAVPFTGSAYLN